MSEKDWKKFRPSKREQSEIDSLFRENPEPTNISNAGRELLEEVYQRYLEEGYSKKRAAMAAWGALKKAGYVRKGSRWVKPRKRNPNPAHKPPHLRKIRNGSELGGMVELEVKLRNGAHKLYRWKRPYPPLWWSPEARVLAVVNGGKVSRPQKPRKLPGKAAKVRRDFQGEEPERVRYVDMPSGRLSRIGTAVRIVYESDKHNGGGDGTRALYEHEFAASDVAWEQNKSGPALIAVTGPRLTVTDRGIVY